MSAVYGREIIYTTEELANGFEYYEINQIYKYGHFVNSKKEDRYQVWLNNYNLVESSVEEYYYNLDYYNNNGDVGIDLDNVQSTYEYEDPEPKIVMRITARPTELEEGEIVDENDIYPKDLLNEEPFIRAPVISAQAAEIMRDEFNFSLCLNEYDL